MVKVITMVCPKDDCGAKINHVEGDNPTRCVSCKSKFVNADDVIVMEGKNPPTVVKVNPIVVKSGVKEAK